jgi:hypothetical protein
MIKALGKTLSTIGIFYLFFSLVNADLNPVSWNSTQRLVLGLIGIFSFYAYQISPNSPSFKNLEEESKEIDKQLNS